MYNNFMLPQRYEIIHVTGRNGAMALNMCANSQVLCLDDTAPIVWLCQTDGAGYKTVTPFDVTPHIEPKPDDIIKEFENRIKALEERLNDKSDYASTENDK